MTALTPEEIAELRRLHAAATPGPWNTTRCGELCPDDLMLHADFGTDRGIRSIRTVGKLFAERTGAAECSANAALIVAAVNALPALLTAAEALPRVEAERDEAKAKYNAVIAAGASANKHEAIALARVAELEAALEWALDNASDSEHPHYPMRGESWPWVFPYLVSGTPSGGGVGEAGFATALEAVQAAVSFSGSSAALSAQPSDDGWRTMESAPKDRAIWLYWPAVGDPDERQCVGWWRDCPRSGGYWMDAADSERGEPSAWRDLPPPPAQHTTPDDRDTAAALRESAAETWAESGAATGAEKVRLRSDADRDEFEAMVREDEDARGGQE